MLKGVKPLLRMILLVCVLAYTLFNKQTRKYLPIGIFAAVYTACDVARYYLAESVWFNVFYWLGLLAFATTVAYTLWVFRKGEGNE